MKEPAPWVLLERRTKEKIMALEHTAERHEKRIHELEKAVTAMADLLLSLRGK